MSAGFKVPSAALLGPSLWGRSWTLRGAEQHPCPHSPDARSSPCVTTADVPRHRPASPGVQSCLG